MIHSSISKTSTKFENDKIIFCCLLSDRCFFGTWGDWSDCQNGVQKKQRQVVQGGMDCQKKAVKTRPCS